MGKIFKVHKLNAINSLLHSNYYFRIFLNFQDFKLINLSASININHKFDIISKRLILIKKYKIIFQHYYLNQNYL